MKTPPVDIHTHNLQALPPAVISVDPATPRDPMRLYSVGIHPWNSAEATDTDLALLDQAALDPSVVAIGETGLDKLRGAPLDRQTQLLRHHIDLSERLGKPLILHIVKAFNEIIELRRQLRPAQPWIIHGFRGGPQLAADLLRHGFDISLGHHFNPATAAIIPDERLHVETDESTLPIGQIAEEVDKARQKL